ncbi:MAG: hypothetical protein GXP62_05570 [Oligoflexia bacterium]|nr:hypothetical protein [Oligoflexia bacterium]
MIAALFLLVACKTVVDVPTPRADLLEVGENLGGGNIVGVQTYVEPASFASAQTLESTLRLWLNSADDEEWLRPDTVVVLPETIGTWLLLADEGANVIAAPDAETALRNLIVAHMPAFLLARTDAPAIDQNQYAIYAMKADDVAAAYQEVMGDLAAEYGVTIVAGSVILPEPQIIDGTIVPTAGAPLRNASFIFDRYGDVLSESATEVYPTAKELESITPSSIGRLPVVDTPAGRIGVLVGSDAWYPDTWDQLIADDAQRVVAPMLTSPHGAWLDAWAGYDGWPAPDDVDQNDVRKVSLADAFMDYGLAGRAQDVGILSAMSVPMRGQMWDQGTDGVITIVNGNQVTEGPLLDSAVVANLWLPERPNRR